MASDEDGETLYCICRKPYEEDEFMIECDICKDWFHGSCVGIKEHLASDIETYHCPNCQAVNGPLVLKKRRNSHRHDYSESDDNSSKAVQTGTVKFIQELKGRHFPSADEIPMPRLPGWMLTKEYLEETGFNMPILVERKDGLDLTIPPSSFTIHDVENHVGSMREIDVIDVAKQEDYKMFMRDWTEYYTSPNRQKIFNVISLEFSNTRLADIVEPPRLIRELSWVSNHWPSDQPPEDQMYQRPEVQRYCLMGVKDSFTDFHIDFGGTSVWYHVLRGEKVFYLIKPTATNLELYLRWASSPKQSEVFFGNEVAACYKCVVKQGQTLFIPTGWIHAVLTPIDSLVFGGNFLHSFNIGLQIQCYEIEKLIKTPEKYLFPNYETVHWYAAKHLLDTIKDYKEDGRRLPEYLQSGAKAMASALKSWTHKKDLNGRYIVIRRDAVPETIQYGRLLKELNKEIKQLAPATLTVLPKHKAEDSGSKKKESAKAKSDGMTSPEHVVSPLKIGRAPVAQAKDSTAKKKKKKRKEEAMAGQTTDSLRFSPETEFFGMDAKPRSKANKPEGGKKKRKRKASEALPDNDVVDQPLHHLLDSPLKIDTQAKWEPGTKKKRKRKASEALPDNDVVDQPLHHLLNSPLKIDTQAKGEPGTKKKRKRKASEVLPENDVVDQPLHHLLNSPLKIDAQAKGEPGTKKKRKRKASEVLPDNDVVDQPLHHLLNSPLTIDTQPKGEPGTKKKRKRKASETLPDNDVVDQPLHHLLDSPRKIDTQPKGKPGTKKKKSKRQDQQEKTSHILPDKSNKSLDSVETAGWSKPTSESPAKKKKKRTKTDSSAGSESSPDKSKSPSKVQQSPFKIQTPFKMQVPFKVESSVKKPRPSKEGQGGGSAGTGTGSMEGQVGHAGRSRSAKERKGGRSSKEAKGGSVRASNSSKDGRDKGLNVAAGSSPKEAKGGSVGTFSSKSGSPGAGISSKEGTSGSPGAGISSKDSKIGSPGVGISPKEGTSVSPGAGISSKEGKSVSVGAGASPRLDKRSSVTAGSSCKEGKAGSAGTGTNLETNQDQPNTHKLEECEAADVGTVNKEETELVESGGAWSPPGNPPLTVRIPKAGAFVDTSVYDFADEPDDPKPLKLEHRSPEPTDKQPKLELHSPSPLASPNSLAAPSSTGGGGGGQGPPKTDTVKEEDIEGAGNVRVKAVKEERNTQGSQPSPALKLKVSGGRIISGGLGEAGRPVGLQLLSPLRSQGGHSPRRLQVSPAKSHGGTTTGETTASDEDVDEEDGQLVVDESPRGKGRGRGMLLQSLPAALHPLALKLGPLRLKLSVHKKPEAGGESSQDSSGLLSSDDQATTMTREELLSELEAAEIDPSVDRMNMPMIRGGLNGSIADILEASGYGTETDFKIDEDIGRASPTMRDAIQGMLSMSRMGGLQLSSLVTGASPSTSAAASKSATALGTRPRRYTYSEDTGDRMPTCFKDEEYVYPTLDTSDNEADHVFKPRGRLKKDETWNPKAKLVPNCPKPERPLREGTRKESVESGLAAAAAKLADKPAPKRQYIRRKPKLEKKGGGSCLMGSEAAATSASLSSSAPAFLLSPGLKGHPESPPGPSPGPSSGPPGPPKVAVKKPKKGMATAKQRLGKILKLHR